jgi:hypothetical protein
MTTPTSFNTNIGREVYRSSELGVQEEGAFYYLRVEAVFLGQRSVPVAQSTRRALVLHRFRNSPMSLTLELRVYCRKSPPTEYLALKLHIRYGQGIWNIFSKTSVRNCKLTVLCYWYNIFSQISLRSHHTRLVSRIALVRLLKSSVFHSDLFVLGIKYIKIGPTWYWNEIWDRYCKLWC